MKERLKENYWKANDTKKVDFVEWIVICEYMDSDDFNNLFRLEELNEGEFYSIVDFLCQQECYITLFMLIARHLKRFQKEDISFLDDITLSDYFEERIEKLKGFTDFAIPEF